MNTKIYLIFLFVSILGLSCTKETNTSESLPKFEGISYFDYQGDLVDSFDSTDWRSDDKFKSCEQKLFDTLKFDNASHLKSTKSGSTDIILKKDTVVRFYPNPCRDVGYFSYHNASIINIVIVDNTFMKKIEYRTQNTEMAFDLTILKAGIYRMYYVFQDSVYKISGLGHGDIKINRDE
jgi:hypothetical protein